MVWPAGTRLIPENVFGGAGAGAGTCSTATIPSEMLEPATPLICALRSCKSCLSARIRASSAFFCSNAVIRGATFCCCSCGDASLSTDEVEVEVASMDLAVVSCATLLAHFRCRVFGVMVNNPTLPSTGTVSSLPVGLDCFWAWARICCRRDFRSSISWSRRFLAATNARRASHPRTTACMVMTLWWSFRRECSSLLRERTLRHHDCSFPAAINC